MTYSRDIPWTRLTFESAAIIASILLAFAIDAWWDGQNDQRRATLLLDQLHQEFSANYGLIDHFETDCTAQCRAELAGNQIYIIVETALSAEAEEIVVPDELLGDLIRTPTFEARTPVLDSAVQTGTLALLDNPSVLAAISDWDRLLRNTNELQLRARSIADDRILPALQQRGDVGHVVRDYYRAENDSAISLDGQSRIKIDSGLKLVIAQRYESIARANRSLNRSKMAPGEVLRAIESAKSLLNDESS